MELGPYVESLREQLAVSAAAGGEEARALAERLSAALESAVRLTLLDAISAAAADITRDLAPGSVEVRLRGSEPHFVVTPAPAEEWEAEAPAPSVPPPLATTGEGDEAAARINFRLPEHLKSRIEQAASAAGLSVNAWLVRAVAASLDTDDSTRGSAPQPTRSGQRFSGWVR
jgi:hypothetical protein